MRADELEEVSLLYDFYGGLLTEKQRDIMEQHYQMDLSLGEIAANEGVTRQAVHDVVRRSTAALRQYEAELGLVARYRERRRQLEELSREVAALKEAWLAILGPDAGGAGQGGSGRGAGHGGAVQGGAGEEHARPAAAPSPSDVRAALMRTERLVYALLQE